MIQLSAEYWTAVAGLFAIAVVFCMVTDLMYAFETVSMTVFLFLFFFYQEYIKRWKTELLSSFEQLTEMGHSNDLFCGEVTELFKNSHIIYNILKWFFHKEVNLLEFIMYLHQSFFWAFRHCVHGAADIIKSAHNARGTLNKDMKKYQNKYVTHCYLEWMRFHIPNIEMC